MNAKEKPVQPYTVGASTNEASKKYGAIWGEPNQPSQKLYANHQTQMVPEKQLSKWKWWKWPDEAKTCCLGCGAGVYDSCKCAPDELPKEENKGYPDNNPKTVFGAKKLPLELVPPSAVAALAEAFADGAKKYGPYNWREKSISSSVYYGAALRHLQAWWDGEDLADDSGIPHLHHAMACLAMLVDGNSVGKLNDNRPPKGAASRLQKEWLEKTNACCK